MITDVSGWIWWSW